MTRSEDSLTAPNTSAREGGTTRDNVTRALWGNRTKMIARPSDRDRIQKFYRDVLGCHVGKGPQHPGGPEDTDLIRFANNFTVVVHYDHVALSDSDQKRAIWLEIQTDNTDEIRKKIEAFGIHGFDYFDREHFYFQAPGGQVFRVARTEVVVAAGSR